MKIIFLFFTSVLCWKPWNFTWNNQVDSRHFQISMGYQSDDADTNLIAFSPKTNSTYIIGSSSKISIDNQTSYGVYNPFLMKYHANGTRLWTRSWGSGDEVSGDFAYAVAVDQEKDEVYITGGASSPLPGSNFQFTAQNGKTNSFLAKFDGEGQLLWIRMWGG
jgi:hypothetical protein